MTHRLASWALAALMLVASCVYPTEVLAQSQYGTSTNTVYPAFVATATSQTGPVIQFGTVNGQAGSFSVGTVSVNGTGLTTVTWSLMGSADGGNTFFALNLNPINTPATTATTETTTSNGLYQVNLSGLTQVKFVTSGTFTATSVSFVLTASPAGVIARLGSGGGGMVFPALGYAFSTGTAWGPSAAPGTLIPFGTDTGTTNAYAVTYTPAITSLTPGLGVIFSPASLNSTTAPTLSVNGLTATVIKKAQGAVGLAALAIGDIEANQPAVVVFDGAEWVLQNPGVYQKSQTATFLIGGALGSIPVQSGNSVTQFLASPTTSGHTFVPSWQPTGIPITPVALDLAALPTTIGTAGTTQGYCFNNDTGIFRSAAGDMEVSTSCTTPNANGVVFAANFAGSTGNGGFGIFAPGSTTAGNQIARNSNDSFATLSVNNRSATATGDITDFQAGSVTVASVLLSGAITSPQFTSTGSAPTMAAGAAAGTSPTCTTITGANQSGVISCTTGTATTTGTLATISFNGTVTTAPRGCHLQATNAATAPVATSVFTTTPSTTSWTIGAASALTASTAYQWSYLCM